MINKKLKKNQKLTYEEFGKRQMRLFVKWHLYYREHALTQFESLMDYSAMIFFQNAEIDNMEGKDLRDKGLTKYLISELEYQLEKDETENYYEKELKDLPVN